MPRHIDAGQPKPSGEPSSSASGEAPFPSLLAIDRLEIGPARLEPRAVVTPYRIVCGDQETVHELSYRFAEDVFDPDSPTDHNLAAMMTAQLALNYGLFCREMVFRGPFDPKDRRFLLDMLANTAREIYVKKLLQPNPFLTGEAAELSTLQRSSYVQASVRFVPESAEQQATAGIAWATSSERFCVLSSGGKDSLLSFGLLRELGYETHPIFVNESGRHWWTAINAFRALSEEIPQTARVWTDSDRLFAAMLRHLPFVRSDFARLRSDEYPIRLWTVAVFLFGVLPLLRKRGIGRLVIGDEHDSTVRTNHRGIPHYDGLYDQSRYFDDALSRYFRAKSWGVTQFSLLRPMSELLIERTLAERYPELLRLQVSCHATHKEGDTIKPCGRCEKCRRIIGMLLAIGVHPGACGYLPEQIEGAVGALVERGVHQERPGSEHLGHLLMQKGVISEPRLGTARARLHPEIEQLRFHPQKSPPDGLPVTLRRPLYRLILQHAGGAVQRLGRKWIGIDLETSRELDAPYPFDAAGDQAPSAVGETILWGEMSWPAAKRRLASVDIALLPVGAIEQHGPHLPLDTDAFDAEYLARRVAEATSEPRPVVLPLIPYGVSYHHEDFRGTLSIDNDTLARLVYDIGVSAAKNGITKLVIVNGHGGNGPALHYAAQMIDRDTRIFTCVDSGETSDTDIEAMIETHNDAHAGEIETSTSLAVRPHLVDMSVARASVPRFSSHYLDFSSSRSVGWYVRTARISESGVLGDPEKASAEKGERIWKVMVENLVELVEHLKELSLEEIHQRRY